MQILTTPSRTNMLRENMVRILIVLRYKTHWCCPVEGEALILNEMAESVHKKTETYHCTIP
jgi:hypothetical protein